MNLPAIALVALHLASADIETIAADVVWVSRGEYCEPETVLALPDNTLLVSNVCDFRAPGTGFLTLLGADGAVIDWRVVDALDAPLGMALVSDRLYVVDSNRVRVLSWPGFEPQTTIDLDTRVANDIAVSPEGVIYVTDTAQGLVVLVEEGEQSVLTGKARFPGANGIALRNRQLLVGGERLWQVDLDSLTVMPLGPDGLTDIDGIEFEPDGTVQVTPVAGPLWRQRPDSGWIIYSDERLSSANHGFASASGLALIPTGYDNTVIAVKVAEPQ